MAPTPKERAVHLSEAGMSAQAVAAILGIDLADVKSLMTDADPAVELASGGGGGGAIPGVAGVNIVPELNAVLLAAMGTDITEYSDLSFISAPTEADAYLLQGDVVLIAKEGASAFFTAYVTDEETFNEWWNGSGALGTPYYSEYGHQAFGPDQSKVNAPLHMIVAAGAAVGIMGVASDAGNANYGVSNTCWIPLG